MPLYMDVHHISGGVAVDDVTKAHLADLQTQQRHDVNYLRYWVDEQQGKIFCLVEAPSAEAASTVHRGFAKDPRPGHGPDGFPLKRWVGTGRRRGGVIDQNL
jgi:hypothetical protein